MSILHCQHLTPALRLEVIHGRNVTLSMEMSSFQHTPSQEGISVPLQTTCTSNSLLSSRVFVRVRRFEAAYRLVFILA
jgi:hypothetical protein